MMICVFRAAKPSWYPSADKFTNAARVYSSYSQVQASEGKFAAPFRKRNRRFFLKRFHSDLPFSRIVRPLLGIAILLFFCCTPASAQLSTNPAATAADSPGLRQPGLRFSLLTVGVGDEIYASFGHTGIRVIDSAAGTDIVYNWGTFEFGEDFEVKFMRGKLLYYCSAQSFSSFYSLYVRERRGVEEQELFLDRPQQQSLLAAIEENMEEENKYYKYDFLFDNCSTRPRDLLKTAFGPGFSYGDALRGQRPTFRDEINHYLAGLPWERFGINLLLGAKIDRVMSNEDAMFLPDYLRDGLVGAKLNGKPVAGQAERLLPPAPAEPAPVNGPLIMTVVVAAICIIGVAIPGFDLIGRLLRYILLIISGLLGILMLFMWFGTDHQTCANNWNVLWCLPTNLVIPFVKRAKRSRYAIVALACIGISLIIHVTGLQKFPLDVAWPLLLSLAVTFFMMYRAAVAPPLPVDDHHH